VKTRKDETHRFNFFCSFGTPLDKYRIQKKKGILMKQNLKRVQTYGTAYCGFHSCFVASHLMQGRSFCNIMGEYKTNTSYNDRIVYNFFHSKRLSPISNDEKHEKVQRCTNFICK